jgi:hypothetical protein
MPNSIPAAKLLREIIADAAATAPDARVRAWFRCFRDETRTPAPRVKRSAKK